MAFMHVEVWIDGVMPLLQNRFGETAEASVPGGTGSGIRSADKTGSRTPREAAEESAYRDSTGCLYFPGAAIGRLLREAGTAHKAKGSRKSLKYKVPAAVLVLDDCVPLYHPDRKTRAAKFEVDSRSVVIPSTKGRVMRHRARIEQWSAFFTIRINTDVLGEQTIRLLLTEGGQQIGVGDFRPEKGGTFGLFDVVAWNCRDGRRDDASPILR